MLQPGRQRPALYTLAVVALLSGCAGVAPPPPQPTASITAPDYVIGPGDTLSVFVYRSPELSAGDLPVRPDGRFSLPLVPDLEAAGRTPTQLGRAIEERLKKYVRDPTVTVMVRGFVGPSNRQIRVIGEAAQPLALPYREGMSVLDAMIASRGLTRFAAGNRARIIRQGEGGTRTSVPVRLSALLNDGDIAQDVPLRPGDTIVIPMSFF